MNDTTKPKHAKPRCPICGRPTIIRTAPFCSRRCADDDLTHWLGGRYAIPGEESADPPAADDPDSVH